MELIGEKQKRDAFTSPSNNDCQLLSNISNPHIRDRSSRRDIFPDDPRLNYHNLEDVHNGTEAMRFYRKLAQLEVEEKARVCKNMLEYCRLDAYAIVRVWERLVAIAG